MLSLLCTKAHQGLTRKQLVPKAFGRLYIPARPSGGVFGWLFSARMTGRTGVIFFRKKVTKEKIVISHRQRRLKLTAMVET
jgi:hypothetical protein